MQTLELKIPPPAAAALIGLAMWWTAHLLGVAHPAEPSRTFAAGACAAFGLALAVLGVREFRRARTTIDPFHPDAAAALVTRGIFSHTRNPIYVGLVAVLLGWAVWLGVPWVFLGPPALMLFLLRFQILPEERVMASKFGRDYQDYRRRVRRWL